MTRNIYNQTGYIDNLIVNGSLDSNLIPSSDLTYTLGDSSHRFKGLYTGIIANTQNVYLNSSSFPSEYPLNITAVNKYGLDLATSLACKWRADKLRELNIEPESDSD